MKGTKGNNLNKYSSKNSEQSEMFFLPPSLFLLLIYRQGLEATKFSTHWIKTPIANEQDSDPQFSINTVLTGQVNSAAIPNPTLSVIFTLISHKPCVIAADK